MRTQIQRSALQGFITESEKNVWPLEFLHSSYPTQPRGTSLITRCQFHFRLVTTTFSVEWFGLPSTLSTYSVPTGLQRCCECHSKTPLLKSVCAALITSVIELTLVTEGNCFGGTVLVFLNWLVLCHPRNGFQKHLLHDLCERYLVRMTALQFPATCFNDGCEICFFPVTGNPIWLTQPLDCGDRKQHNEVTHLSQHIYKQLLFSPKDLQTHSLLKSLLPNFAKWGTELCEP